MQKPAEPATFASISKLTSPITVYTGISGLADKQMSNPGRCAKNTAAAGIIQGESKQCMDTVAHAVITVSEIGSALAELD